MVGGSQKEVPRPTGATGPQEGVSEGAQGSGLLEPLSLFSIQKSEMELRSTAKQKHLSLYVVGTPRSSAGGDLRPPPPHPGGGVLQPRGPWVYGSEPLLPALAGLREGSLRLGGTVRGLASLPASCYIHSTAPGGKAGSTQATTSPAEGGESVCGFVVRASG